MGRAMHTEASRQEPLGIIIDAIFDIAKMKTGHRAEMQAPF